MANETVPQTGDKRGKGCKWGVGRSHIVAEICNWHGAIKASPMRRGVREEGSSLSSSMLILSPPQST